MKTQIIAKLIALLLTLWKWLEFAIGGLIYFCLCGLIFWIICELFPGITNTIPQVMGNEVLVGGVVGLLGHFFFGNFNCAITSIIEVEPIEVDDTTSKGE